MIDDLNKKYINILIKKLIFLSLLATSPLNVYYLLFSLFDTRLWDNNIRV